MQFNYPDVVLGIDQKRLLEDGEQDQEIVVSDETTNEEEAEINDQSVGIQDTEGEPLIA